MAPLSRSKYKAQILNKIYEERLQDLEEKIAFQEDTIQKMDSELVYQQKKIKSLEKSIFHMRETFKKIEDNMNLVDEVQPPPHY